MCVLSVCGVSAAGDKFAIKVMTKADLVRKNMVESVTNERNILAMVRIMLVDCVLTLFAV